MLTYAGIPLTLPDADGELAYWLRQNLNVADLVEFGSPTLAALSPKRGLLPWLGERKGMGQTFANYAAPPAPRLNTLYWPTGATRWARGYFLATEEQKNKITAQAHAELANAPLSLRWGDSSDRPVMSASMYLLPPRAISRDKAKHSSSESLWLLPLVDARYWWQFRNVDDLEVDDTTTWATLFSDLSTALDVTVSLPTAADAAYKEPDTYEFTRRFENAAIMLDAAALSIGKRIVRRLDGTVRAESFDDADTVMTENKKLDHRTRAGNYCDDEQGYKPAKVLVTFRKWRYYRLLQRGQVYTVDKDPSDTNAIVTGTKKIVHSTFMADCSTDDDSPSNTSDLDALAEKIAADYYGWFGKRHDLTFAGAMPWVPCGYDDSVMWEWGSQGGAATGRLAQTRVQSMPVDFGFDIQLSQDKAKTLLESPVLGKVDTSISKNNYGTVNVWQGRSDARAESAISIEAYASATDLTDNTKLVAANWVDDDWEVGPWECKT